MTDAAFTADRTEVRLIGAVWLVLLIGTAAIASAWFFELVLGYRPCALCLQQRTPYYVGLPIAAVALIMSAFGARVHLLKAGLIAIFLAFVFGAALAAWHAGIEWGFWPGPADCSGRSGGGPALAQDLLGAMKATRVVSCTDAAWRLFGLSLAGWNALVSMVLAAIALRGLMRPA